MKETIYLIMAGSVEKSRDESYEDKVGVVSIVFASRDKERVQERLTELQEQNREVFFN